MNYELTTQEKINTLKKVICDLKEIPFEFNTILNNQLIYFFEKEIEFLIDGEYILRLQSLGKNNYDIN